MKEIDILNIRVNPLTETEMNETVSASIKEGYDSAILAHHNLHSVFVVNHDEQMQQFYAEANWTHIDGMALILLGRVLGHRLERNQRVTYVDWIEVLFPKAETDGWKIFYLGSKPGVAEKGVKKILERYPLLQIRSHSGYFDVANHENEDVCAIINKFAPHILMVGMGMPRQEHWILQNRDKLDSVNVILPSGACMDYIAGEVQTPPRWMGQVGLEWAYRLSKEPKRLGKRYLIEPWYVLFLLMKELITKLFRKKTVFTK